MKKRFIPSEISTKDLHQHLLGSVSPRPIAFVSTIDEDGRENIAPYSFFNVFSSNPPLAVFSSNRRVVDNTTKDTLHNIETNKECVINVVSYDIMRQMALSSVTFPSDVSEFEMAGLTPVPSEMVAPPSLKESPVNMECKVRDIIKLGDHGGAGHLILCDIVLMHIAEHAFDETGRIHPDNIDLVGRMGRSFYVRASGNAVYRMFQPVTGAPIGYPGLPDYVKESKLLTANDVASLAALEEVPTDAEVADMAASHPMASEDAFRQAQKWIAEDKRHEALTLLLSLES